MREQYAIVVRFIFLDNLNIFHLERLSTHGKHYRSDGTKTRLDGKTTALASDDDPRKAVAAF
jgi:hypothetical protein